MVKRPPDGVMSVSESMPELTVRIRRASRGELVTLVTMCVVIALIVRIAPAGSATACVVMGVVGVYSKTDPM